MLGEFTGQHPARECQHSGDQKSAHQDKSTYSNVAEPAKRQGGDR